MKKYIWQTEELEKNIEKEETLRIELEEKKKKLKELIYYLGEKIKRLEDRISSLEYKIYKNNRFMEKYNPSVIKALARLTLPISAISFMGILGVLRYSSIISLGSVASIAGGMVLSYAVYDAFLRMYKRKEKENTEYTKMVKELLTEKESLANEINLSLAEILKIEEDIKLSTDKTKKLEKDLKDTVITWNDEMDKKIDDIPSKKDEFKNFILAKKAPKEVYDGVVTGN